MEEHGERDKDGKTNEVGHPQLLLVGVGQSIKSHASRIGQRKWSAIEFVPWIKLRGFVGNLTRDFVEISLMDRTEMSLKRWTKWNAHL